MKLEAKKYLYDIQHALGLLQGFTASAVDDRLVWAVIETKIPILQQEIESFL